MKRKLRLGLPLVLAMVAGFAGSSISINRTAAMPSVAAPFVGTWQTTWKNPDGTMASAPVTVTADSTEAGALDGVVEMKGPNGVLFGTVSSDGKKWSGEWWNSRGEKGTFAFTLKGTKNFDGSYTLTGTTGDFSWNGSK